MSKYHIIDYSLDKGYDDKADCNTMAEVTAHAKDYLSEGATKVYVFRGHELRLVFDRRFLRGRKPLQSEVSQFDNKESKLSDHILQIAKDEDAIMRLILQEHGGNMGGGLTCHVKGKEGNYNVELIYLNKGTIMCHIDQPYSCMKYIRFDSLSICERMQIIDRVIAIDKTTPK